MPKKAFMRGRSYKMSRISLVLIFGLATVFGLETALAQGTAQKAPAAPAKAAAGAMSKGRAVLATDPVITIQGLCDGATSEAGTCRTLVSRRDFESFLKALSATTAGVEPSVYRKVAQNYFSLLLYAESGQRTGADKDPRFERVMESTRLRALADMYRVQKMELALHIRDEEVEAYYKKHIDDFEEVDLDRFQVPKNNIANLSDVEFRTKAKQLAEDLRVRAVKGEDVTKLEKEALNALNVKESSNVQIGLRRGQFKEEDEKTIFALRQGEVTPVSDAGGLWMFFKRTSRETLPFAMVKNEIHGILYGDKTVGLDKALHDAVHVDYNEAYFATSPTTFQNAANGASSAGNSTAKKEVAPGDTVITIHGLCGSQKPETGPCIRAITRAQFEPLLRIALINSATATSAIPRSIAEGYVNDLIYADAAEKAGIDKDARLPGVMMLVRQRALGDLYRLKEDEKARGISKEGIEAYYQKNPADFEELTLTHISVPRQRPRTPSDADFEAKAKRLAYELQGRAIAGEDMEKLQKEVYQTLGLQSPYANYEAQGIKTPPVSSLKPIRRGEIEQKTETEVFALKPGEFTSVREFPSAYVIYKLESRRMIPLEEVTAEISTKIFQQNMAKLMGAFASVQVHYNERYFAPVAAVKHASASANTAAK
jgi:parvulin-like peptidyl-prolyl isomerase